MATRAKVKRERGGGRYTEAGYVSFIRGTLRKAWMRWAPNNDTKTAARLTRGIYECAGHNTEKHHVPASIKIDGKRHNNVFTDHIKPVVDPHVGFISWDSFIAGLFCEADNLQVLCKACHDTKTLEERAIIKARKKA